MRDTASRTTRRANPGGIRLGERLRQLRVAAGLTQSELAGDRLGVDTGFLANGVATDERARLEAALGRAEALYQAQEDEEAEAAFEPLPAAARATGVPELQVRALCGA